MTTLTCLLVGAHFRPPAKQLLTALPAGQQLLLVPEPDNAYDPLAVKVLFDPASLPADREALNGALEGTGFMIEDLSPTEPFHLGYLAAVNNKNLANRPDLSSNLDALQALSHPLQDATTDADDPPLPGPESGPPWPATLGFEPSGQPLVFIKRS